MRKIVEKNFKNQKGTKNFSMPMRMKKAFKKGLVKTAESTDSWIITNGSSSGVMKLIGEAVAENSQHTKFTVIGILNRNSVAFRDKLEVKS